MKTATLRPSKQKFPEITDYSTLFSDSILRSADHFADSSSPLDESLPIALLTNASVSSSPPHPASAASPSPWDRATAGDSLTASDSLSAAQDLSSAQDRLEFKARLVRAGRIRRGDGSPGPFSITSSALYSAYIEGMFEGLAVFIDHPGWFDSPSIKSLVGVTYETDWDNATDSVNATIRFYNTEDNQLANAVAQTLKAVLDDQTNGILSPDIGMSIVFWPEWEPESKDPKELKSFRKIDSADIVFGPAADGRILEALSTARARSGPFRMKEVNPMSEPFLHFDEVVDPEPQELDDPADTQPAAKEALQAWTAAAGREAARSIVLHSNLPQISRDKLLKQTWTDPEALYVANEEEREYLAQLTQSNVITLKGPLP